MKCFIKVAHLPPRLTWPPIMAERAPQIGTKSLLLFPLTLAYACTIHKVQGFTLKNVLIIFSNNDLLTMTKYMLSLNIITRTS